MLRHGRGGRGRTVSFTMFDKIGDACARLNDGDRALVFAALCEYGFYGTMPELPYPLDVVAASFGEDVDNSKERRAAGSKGGRPRKPVPENRETGVSESSDTGRNKLTQTPKPVSENKKTQVSETEKPVSENQKTQVSETRKPVSETSETKVSVNAKPKPDQARPNQTSPNQGETPPARARDGGAFWEFAAQCHEAWNRILDADVREFSPEADLGLRRAWDNGRRLSDVELAIRNAKAGWEPRYVTPNAVLGRRLEDLINLKEAERDDDFDKYALVDSI
jgi:hypothetical protein